MVQWGFKPEDEGLQVYLAVHHNGHSEGAEESGARVVEEGRATSAINVRCVQHILKPEDAQRARGQLEKITIKCELCNSAFSQATKLRRTSHQISAREGEEL